MIDLRPMGAVTVDPTTGALACRAAPSSARSTCGAGARARDHGRQRLAHGRRRAHLRRRHGVAGAASTACRATTWPRSSWSRATARSSVRAPGRTPTCTGRSAAAAATSASSRTSSSPCTRAGPAISASVLSGRWGGRADATLARSQHDRAAAGDLHATSPSRCRLGSSGSGTPRREPPRSRSSTMSSRRWPNRPRVRRADVLPRAADSRGRRQGYTWRRYWKGHYFDVLGDDVIDACSHATRPTCRT
jgi:hypothetical protein